MLDSGRDKMFSGILFLPCYTFDHPVIRLAPTGRKEDFLRLRIDYPRDFFSRLLNGIMHPHAHIIGSGRITILLPEVRFHRLTHLGQHLRCSRMIHINSTTHISCPLFIQ